MVQSGNLTVCELENGPVGIVDLPITVIAWCFSIVFC